MIAKSGKAAQIDMVTWMHRPSIVQGYLDHLLEGQQTQFIQPFEDWWEDFNVSFQDNIRFDLFVIFYYYLLPTITKGSVSKMVR
jgi:hypothetical protein